MFIKQFLIVLLTMGMVNTSVAAENEPQATEENDQQLATESSEEENDCKNSMVACYGIADAGQNENILSPDVNGHNYGYGEAPPCHPEAYICLPEGTDCSRIIVGQAPNLDYVRGTGKPDLNRPKVDVCYPYNYAEKNPMFPNPEWEREVDII